MFGHDMPRAAEVRPAESLGELARAINAEFRRTLEGCRTIGLMLERAKALCKQGQWGPWLEENVKLSRSHATRLMKVARNWHVVSGARTLNEAMRLLTEEPGDEPNVASCNISHNSPSDQSPGREDTCDEKPASSPPPPPPPPLREPSPPVKPKPPWSAPAASRNGPSKPAARERQEQAAFEEKHVKPLLMPAPIDPAERVGARLAGARLTARARAVEEEAGRLQLDVQELSYHLGASPAESGPAFVALAVATDLCLKLSVVMDECVRRELGGQARA